jgi:hypothetical protein
VPPEQQFAAHLHWAQVDDVVFLLDGRRGEYFGLDADASRHWLRLAGSEVAAPDLGSEDLGRLIAAARRRGWLVSSEEDSARTPRRRRRAGARAWRSFPALGAYLCLAQAFVLVRLRGFAPAYAWARSLAPASTTPPHDAAAFASTMRAFLRAEHFVVSRLGPDDCLPRSLALFALLARCGVPARHRIGVRRYPFAAHAWVEDCNGFALALDRSEQIAEFTPIATIG